MPCNNPDRIKVHGEYVTIPCRNCMGCRIDNRNYWTLRGRYEAFTQYKKGRGNCFTTLTYTPENTPVALNGKMTLRKKDLQDYFKRCRKWLNKKKGINIQIRYMACGEYGGLNGKPHMHIIFFGLPYALAEEMTRNTWREGISQTKALNGAHIRYTLKYMEKQEPYKIRKDLKEKYGYECQFIVRSKGIGAEMYKKMGEESLFINSRMAYAPKYWRNKYDIPQKTYKEMLLKDEQEEKRAKWLGMPLKRYKEECRIAREYKQYTQTILDGRAAKKMKELQHNELRLKTLALSALKDIN